MFNLFGIFLGLTLDLVFFFSYNILLFYESLNCNESANIYLKKKPLIFTINIFRKSQTQEAVGNDELNLSVCILYLV